MIQAFLRRLMDKILSFFGSVEAKARLSADTLVKKEQQVEETVRSQFDKIIPPPK
jgi:1,2-phenylacetyl-CoA epoxidase catalytic subunit